MIQLEDGNYNSTLVFEFYRLFPIEIASPLLTAIIKYFRENQVYVPIISSDYNYYLNLNISIIREVIKERKLEISSKAPIKLFELDLKDSSWIYQPPFYSKIHTWVYLHVCGFNLLNLRSILNHLFLITIKELPVSFHA